MQLLSESHLSAKFFVIKQTALLSKSSFLIDYIYQNPGKISATLNANCQVSKFWPGNAARVVSVRIVHKSLFSVPSWLHIIIKQIAVSQGLPITFYTGTNPTEFQKNFFSVNLIKYQKSHDSKYVHVKVSFITCILELK